MLAWAACHQEACLGVWVSGLAWTSSSQHPLQSTLLVQHDMFMSTKRTGMALAGNYWVLEAVLGAKWVGLTGACSQEGCRAA